MNHREDPKLRDRIGHPGDKEDICLEVAAGSVAVESSRDFNRSGSNTTPNIPRIHLPHDSPGPMK
ncbi:MAG: phytanoyl-CoA dioxygenase family protein, partial [Spirochaetota bacterium]